MFFLACAITFIWFCGALFRCGRSLNLMRQMYNNVVPGVNVGGPEYNSVRKVMNSELRPELLNIEGQRHLKKMNRNSWLFGAWMLMGFPLMIWLSRFS